MNIVNTHTHTHTHTHMFLTPRYEGLRATLYQLQSKLMAMTGEDPLKDKGVSIIAPQFSPNKDIARSSDGICVLTAVHIFNSSRRECVGKGER